MPEISTLFSAYKVHIIWAAVLIVVVGLVHFWPTLKAWPGKVAAWFKREEKNAVAVEELVAKAIAARGQEIGIRAAQYISTFEARMQAVEKAVQAQVQADEAKASAAVSVLKGEAIATPAPGPFPPHEFSAIPGPKA